MRHVKWNECDLSCSGRAWDNVVAIKSKDAQEGRKGVINGTEANHLETGLHCVRGATTRDVEWLGLGLSKAPYAGREGRRIRAVGRAERRSGGGSLTMGEVRVGS